MCVLPMRIRRTKTDKDRINLDKKTVTVIGAGLAGVEAAWALANRGFHVRLCEMKPEKYSPAHKYKGFAELVCSNSLKSADTASACGMLKEEMRYMNSVTMKAAEKTKVGAGGALAVNRTEFSDAVTEMITNQPYAMAIRLTLVRSLRHSSRADPCRQALAWVQSSTSCTMTKAQE